MILHLAQAGNSSIRRNKLVLFLIFALLPFVLEIIKVSDISSIFIKLATAISLISLCIFSIYLCWYFDLRNTRKIHNDDLSQNEPKQRSLLFKEYFGIILSALFLPNLLRIFEITINEKIIAGAGFLIIFSMLVYKTPVLASKKDSFSNKSTEKRSKNLSVFSYLSWVLLPCFY